MDIKTEGIKAEDIQSKDVIVYRNQQHTIKTVTVLEKYVHLIEPNGHIIYRKVGAIVQRKVKRTYRRQQAA